MAENIAEVNDSEHEYPTDELGELVVAVAFAALDFIESGRIDEAKECLKSLSGSIPLPREDFIHYGFVVGVNRTKRASSRFFKNAVVKERSRDEGGEG